MENLTEFVMQTIETAFIKAKQNLMPLLITAFAPAFLFAPYIIEKFPLYIFQYTALRIFLFLLFFFDAFLSSCSYFLNTLTDCFFELSTIKSRVLLELLILENIFALFTEL
jgi:hypothetical protein